MSNMFSLEGKIALITGASYGIGYAIAKAYAEAGAKIVFNDIKQELVDKGLAAYKADGIDAKGYVCDVTDEEAVQAFEYLSKMEGIIPAIESAHALAHAMKIAPAMPGKNIVVNVSGRGDKDCVSVARYRGEDLSE